MRSKGSFVAEVELNKARAASEQHRGEFDSRSREQMTKIHDAQATIETLTRELSVGRQRHFDEEVARERKGKSVQSELTCREYLYY